MQSLIALGGDALQTEIIIELHTSVYPWGAIRLH